MKKSVKVALIIGAVALVISVGLISTRGIIIDPPYGFINLL